MQAKLRVVSGVLQQLAPNGSVYNTRPATHLEAVVFGNYREISFITFPDLATAVKAAVETAALTGTPVCVFSTHIPLLGDGGLFDCSKPCFISHVPMASYCRQVYVALPPVY